MALCLRWFQAQPFTSVMVPDKPQTWTDAVAYTLEACLKIATACLGPLLPVLVLQLGAGREIWRNWLRKPLPLVVGLLASAAVMRLLAGMLFGVTPLDLATLAGASALLAGVAVLASAVPARRAARIDPASALRAE